jgi:23S rRNA (uracil1939-C5)-methyltransferase
MEMKLFHGAPYIRERLRHVEFKVGPKSFFQTNTKQAENLYDVIVDFAGLDGSQNVYDLYTGVGSIALYLAKSAKQVVGIEELAPAIEDAKENAKMNEIDNCVFYAGDVKDILTDEFAREHGQPDLVITDPPRAGMHGNVIDMFLKLESPKIVYVSCNPSTQARDLALLSAKYDVSKMRAVDMFPHTHHIESVALLELKKEIKIV